MTLADYIRNNQRGTLQALSVAIGAHPPDVSRWMHGERAVPVQHCVSIERVTAGAVTRQELRPDDYWRIWPDLPAPEGAKEAGHA